MERERKDTRDVYLLLGSNLGDRTQNIQSAEAGLGELGTVINRSQIYRTEPWEMDSDDWFFNRVVQISTTLEPESLMQSILSLEEKLGRVRESNPTGEYTSRTIDIDILYYGDAVIQGENLTIPHPRIEERRFALAPMVELAPSFIHPIFKRL